MSEKNCQNLKDKYKSIAPLLEELESKIKEGIISRDFKEALALRNQIGDILNFIKEVIDLNKLDGIKKSKNFREYFVTNYEVKEENVFTTRELAEAIKRAAQRDGMNMDSLEVEKIVYDKEGKLIGLLVDITDNSLFTAGSTKEEYELILKGSDQTTNEFSSTTHIAKVYYKEEEGKLTVIHASCLAEYIDGEWILKK